MPEVRHRSNSESHCFMLDRSRTSSQKEHAHNLRRDGRELGAIERHARRTDTTSSNSSSFRLALQCSRVGSWSEVRTPNRSLSVCADDVGGRGWKSNGHLLLYDTMIWHNYARNVSTPTSVDKNTPDECPVLWHRSSPVLWHRSSPFQWTVSVLQSSEMSPVEYNR